MPISDFNVYLEDFGLDYTKGISTLRDLYAGGSDAAKVAAARVDMPWWIGYCTCISAPLGVPNRVPTPGAPAWTDAQILDTSFCVALANDKIIETGGGIGQGWYFGAYSNSRANIIWPHGSYYCSSPILGHFGKHIGQGPSQSAPDLNTPQNEIGGGTRMSIWHENWQDVPAGQFGPRKYCIETLNFPKWVGGTRYVGMQGASGAQGDNILDTVYMEGFGVQGIRFDGRKQAAPEAMGGGDTYVTTYEDAGVAGWRFGRNSFIDDCIFDNFNNGGLQVAGGVPLRITNCGGFGNNLASLWLRGECTVSVDGWECDDSSITYLATGFVDPLSPSNFMLQPQNVLATTQTKIETGVTAGLDKKGTMLLDGYGQIVFTADGVRYSGLNSYPEMLCRVTPNLAGTTSSVHVRGLLLFGYVRTLLHHANGSSSKKWFVDLGEYADKYASAIHEFSYNSANNGSLTTNGGAAAPFLPVTYTNRLKTLASPRVESWNDTAGTPIYTNPAS